MIVSNLDALSPQPPDPRDLETLAAIVTNGDTLAAFNHECREAARARVMMLRHMVRAQLLARRLVAAGLPLESTADLYYTSKRDLAEVCRRLISGGMLEAADPVFTGVESNVATRPTYITYIV